MSDINTSVTGLQQLDGMPGDIPILPNNPSYNPQRETDDWCSIRISRKEEVIYKTVYPDRDYTIKANDRYVIPIGTAASTVTLPEVSDGKVITVKNNSSGAVTIDGNGHLIDGSSTKSLAATYNAVTLVFCKKLGASGFLGIGYWSIVNEI